MKTSNNTKILVVIISVCVLVGVFLLQKSETDKSPDHENRLFSKQEKPQTTNNIVPSHNPKSEVKQVKPLEEVRSTTIEPVSNSKASESLVINDDLEDFFVDEIGNELRAKLGSHVFEMEPVEITDHPESVVVEFKPELGNIHKYELFSKSCDENGNILDDPSAATASIGKWKYEVIAVSDDANSFTIKESIGGESIKAGSKFKLSVEKMPPIFEKVFTYAKDGSLLKAEYKGRDVTSTFQQLPHLVFPQKKLRVGDNWVCGEGPESNWKIEANISGFARISGHDCVVVEFEETHQPENAEPGMRRVDSIKRTGKQYYDFEKMMLVRKEYVETMEGDFGFVSSFVVRNLLGK